MHEAAIAQSILQIVSTRIKETPNTDLALNVQVLIGEFRNVDAESLEFAFDSLKELYPGCGSCRLDSEFVQATAFCSKANHAYHPEPERAFRCTECGGGIGRLTCGEELDVVTITLQCATNEEEK